MSENLSHNFNYAPPGGTVYDYGELRSPFTQENTAAVDSIKDFLSESELIQARRLETVYYSPVFQNVIGTFIPGLRSYSTSFCLYLRRYEGSNYYGLLKNFMAAVCAGQPKLNPDAVHWDWFRVTTPDGDRHYPLGFHGDLEAWIDRMIAVATEKGTTVGWFDRGQFCLNDGRRMAFGDLRLDRLIGGEVIPRDW